MINQTFYRDVSIDPASIDTENRIVPVSFSSDQPVSDMTGMDRITKYWGMQRITSI